MSTIQEMHKYITKAAQPKSGDLLLNVGTPLFISGTAHSTNFNFGVQIDYEVCSKNAKYGYKSGVVQYTYRYWKVKWDHVIQASKGS